MQEISAQVSRHSFTLAGPGLRLSVLEKPALGPGTKWPRDGSGGMEEAVSSRGGCKLNLSPQKLSVACLSRKPDGERGRANTPGRLSGQAFSRSKCLRWGIGLFAV